MIKLIFLLIFVLSNNYGLNVLNLIVSSKYGRSKGYREMWFWKRADELYLDLISFLRGVVRKIIASKIEPCVLSLISSLLMSNYYWPRGTTIFFLISLEPISSRANYFS